MLKKVKKVVINDGKVVMVELVVRDTEAGVDFTTVGRATCDLTEDVFNLETGTALAEERAFEKAIKKALKRYNYNLKVYLKYAERQKEIIDSLTTKAILSKAKIQRDLTNSLTSEEIKSKIKTQADLTVESLNMKLK